MKSVVTIIIFAFLVFPAFPLDLTVDCGKKHQIIHGFGTCMKSWGDPAKDPVSKWKGTEECAKLYVDELGFNMVRIPITKWVLGGPNRYGIPSPDVEPLKKDPELISWKDFSWERSKGRAQDVPKCQIEWAKSMLARDPNIKVFGSVWSPPHWMKEKAKSGAGKKFNWSKYGASSCGGHLSPKYYDHYAKYLAEWSKGLKEKYGINLYAISVQNEMYFYEPYDSCVYAYNEFAPVVRAIGKTFEKEGITTRIMGPEDMTKFPGRTARYLSPFENDPELQKYLSIVCSHGYSDGIETNLEEIDAAVFWKMMHEKIPNAEYWMTETGGGNGSWEDMEKKITKGKKKGQTQVIPGALTGFATMMHNALVYGNASVWTTWQFITGEESCQHGLVYVTMEKFHPTKKFYVQKHFSRYTPAGSYRVEAGPDRTENVAVCAFTHEETGVLTIILQNHNKEEKSITLTLNGAPEASILDYYITDEERNCEKQVNLTVSEGKVTVNLPPRSIVTLTNWKAPVKPEETDAAEGAE